MPAHTPHSLTTALRPSLILALALSLALHLLPFLPDFNFGQNLPSTVAPMQAEIRLTPPPITQAPLTLPKQKPQAEQPAERAPLAKSPKPVQSGTNWTQAVRQHFQTLDRQKQFYPAEAIRQGMEGDALILLIIDEQGRVVASRLEQSSGHPLLDEAALRAVRSLQSLPDDAPRQTLLPVKFRLK